MNLNQDFVKTKKKAFPKNGTLFSQILVDTYTQMHTKVKLLWDAYVDHTQTIKRDTVKLLRDISPPGIGTPDYVVFITVVYKLK